MMTDQVQSRPAKAQADRDDFWQMAIDASHVAGAFDARLAALPNPATLAEIEGLRSLRAAESADPATGAARKARLGGDQRRMLMQRRLAERGEDGGFRLTEAGRTALTEAEAALDELVARLQGSQTNFGRNAFRPLGRAARVLTRRTAGGPQGEASDVAAGEELV